MINGVWFSAKLKCRNTDALLGQLREMVPSIAESVENQEYGFCVRFAGGEARVRCGGGSISIEIDAEDATVCMGIKAALAATLLDHLEEPPLSILFPKRPG